MRLGILLPVFILTTIIPLSTLLILDQLGMMQSRLLLTAEERIYPLLIYLALLLLILLKVIPNHFTEELYYYFLGLALTNITCLLLAITGSVVSLHMAGIGSLLMFLVILSLHFEKNIVAAISLCTFACGLVASSRLFLQAHGRASTLSGWLIGIIAQLILIQFWV